MTYDCAAPASTPFEVAVGPMASSAGAPVIASLRTIKSDVVVGLGDQGDEIAERLDKAEPGWKISGKYVSGVTDANDLSFNRFIGRSTSFRRSSRRASPLCLKISFSKLDREHELSVDRYFFSYPHSKRATHISEATPIFTPEILPTLV